MTKYAIGITTYDYRFDSYFKKLVDSIRSYRHDIPIVVTINGNYKENFNEDYRKSILLYCSTVNNIYPIIFPEFRGLSKLWNTCLIHSPVNKMLILNDDISITSSKFFDDLESYTEKDLFKINGSWSHYFVDRMLVDKIGWFDERLLGIGEEDGDFEFRYGTLYNSNISNINIDNVINHIEYDGSCKNMNIVFGKYSAFNRYFMWKQKYKIDIEKGKVYGISNQPLVCCSQTPYQYLIESFFWSNKNNL